MSKPVVKVVSKTVGTRTFFNLVVVVDDKEFPVNVCYGKTPSYKATQFLVGLIMRCSYVADVPVETICVEE